MTNLFEGDAVGVVVLLGVVVEGFRKCCGIVVFILFEKNVLGFSGVELTHECFEVIFVDTADFDGVGWSGEISALNIDRWTSGDWVE